MAPSFIFSGYHHFTTGVKLDRSEHSKFCIFLKYLSTKLTCLDLVKGVSVDKIAESSAWGVFSFKCARVLCFTNCLSKFSDHNVRWDRNRMSKLHIYRIRLGTIAKLIDALWNPITAIAQTQYNPRVIWNRFLLEEAYIFKPQCWGSKDTYYLGWSRSIPHEMSHFRQGDESGNSQPRKDRCTWNSSIQLMGICYCRWLITLSLDTSQELLWPARALSELLRACPEQASIRLSFYICIVTLNLSS